MILDDTTGRLRRCHSVLHVEHQPHCARVTMRSTLDVRDWLREMQLQPEDYGDELVVEVACHDQLAFLLAR